MIQGTAPPIPPIVDPELLEAVSSLVGAADGYRKVLFLAAEADPKVLDLVLRHEDLLHLCDQIIDAWRNQLGPDAEDKEDRPA